MSHHPLTSPHPSTPQKGHHTVSDSFEKLSFYWLHLTPLEKILPRFLEKLYAQGICGVIRTPHTHRVEEINRLLWTYSPASFLPHGNATDGFFEDQPFWITSTEEIPPQATVLILIDGASATDLSAFHRAVYFFDAHQPEEVQKASAYGESLLKQGIPSQVLLQTATGQWEDKGSFQKDFFL
ncbi:MAG: DNA polymerase III subunit chi [Holosporales bacterium]|nr:DNA polymerase III subunit chi [Holosporales bacterium]